MLDLASGQGELAQACVAERVPYHGFTLSECHSGKLEMILTNFVVTQMQTEGSTFYRSDAVVTTDSSNKRAGEESQEERPKAKAKAKWKVATVVVLKLRASLFQSS